MSDVKEVVLANAEELLTRPHKTAILNGATRRDRYREPGSEWQQADMARWQHGAVVEAVNHFGRHITQAGDVLAIMSFDTMRIVQHARVRRIMMCSVDALTESEAISLGYESVADFQAHHSELHGRHMWMVYIQRLNTGEPPALTQ